jgi:hypothetical protein
VRPAADAACHDRAQSVGADRQASPDSAPLSRGVPYQRTSYGSSIVQQLLDGRSFQNSRAGTAGRADQLAIEESSR